GAPRSTGGGCTVAGPPGAVAPGEAGIGVSPRRPALLRHSGGPVPASGVAAAVDADDLAGDVAGLVSDQESAGGGDVLRSSDPANRDPRRVVVDSLAEETLALGRPQHGRVDEPGRDRVHRDPLRTELQGKCLGEPDDAGLRRHVVRHARLAPLGARRGDVNDPPPTSLDQVGHDRLAAVERAGELTARIRFHWSALIDRKGSKPWSPALFTRMVGRPRRRRTSATPASIWERS